MSWDEELWAVALAVMRSQGDRAALFVATRIGSLAAEGDAAGVATWRQVAANMDALMREASSPC